MKHKIIIFIASAVLLFALHAPYFISYATAPVVAGMDTNGHAQLGKYYAENIFPSSWGWAPKWFAGMPFPQFYPPLFYMAVALLSKVFFFASYETVFKIFIIALTLSIPGFLAMVASCGTKRRSSWWLAGISSVFLLSTVYPKYDNLGVSLMSTFSVGLVTQLFGFVVLLIWLSALLGSKKSKPAYIASIIFLAMTALSSIHVLAVAVIIFIAYFIVEERKLFIQPKKYFSSSETYKRVLKFYLVPGILAVALTAFWVLPMLSVYEYMPKKALGTGDGIGASSLWVILRRWWVVLFFLGSSAVVSVWKRHRLGYIAVLSSLTIFIPIVFKFNEIFPNLPIHTYRYLPFAFYISAVLAGIVFDAAAPRLTKIPRAVLFLILLSLFAIPWFSSRNALSRGAFYSTYESDRAFEIADYLKDKSGMYSVESNNVGRHLNYVIGQSAGALMRSNYTVFVESSLSSIFYVPLRSAFSPSSERMSIRTALLRSKDFTKKDPDALAKAAKSLGVNYFVVRSEPTKEILDSSEKFVLGKDFGTWAVYSLSAQTTNAEIPEHEPAIVFAPLGIEGKFADEFSYMYLQERAFEKGYLDLTMVRAGHEFLDDARDINNFSFAVVSDYRYSSLEKARDNLVRFAEHGRLILVRSNDPLYAMLRTEFAGNPRVSFVSILQKDSAGKIRNTTIVTDQVIDLLDANKVAIADRPAVSANIGRERIDIALDHPANRAMPVVIKSSYFPAWKQASGDPVYMATPAFSLIFTQATSTVAFKKPIILYAGYAVTFTAIATIFIIARRPKRDF